MKRGRVFFFILLYCFPCLLSFPANHKKNERQKIFFFPHNRVRSWLAYPESLCFQVSHCFWFAVITQGAWQRAYVAEKIRKKTFPYCFWFAVIAQGARQRAYIAEKTKKKFPYCFWFAAIAQCARQRAYAVREGNSLRLKQKYLIIKLIRYERFKKKNPSL